MVMMPQINYMWMVLNKQQRWYLCLYTFIPVYYTCIFILYYIYQYYKNIMYIYILHLYTRYNLQCYNLATW